MDKLPCSTSFLMSINFDGLKEVVEFFHKNINNLNERIKDLNLKFKGYEDMQSQLKENNIKTESSLRLLHELEERLNNYSKNIMDNSQKIESTKEKYNQLKEDIEKMKLDNQNNLNEIKNIIENSKQSNKEEEKRKIESNELKEEILKIKNENKNDFENIQAKIEILENNINLIKENLKQNDNIFDINKKNENKDEINNKENNEQILLYNNLVKRVSIIEESINNIKNEISNKEIQINPLANKKITEIKETHPSNAENKLIEKEDKPDTELFTKNFESQLNEISNKIINLENEIISIKNTSKEKVKDNEIDNNLKKVNIENEKLDEVDVKDNNFDDKPDNLEDKTNHTNKKIENIASEIDKINNKLDSDEFMKNKDFKKFSQKLDIKFKNYNDTINNILSKEYSSNKINGNSFQNSINRRSSEEDYNEKNQNNSRKNLELLRTIESNTRSMILEYLKKLDISKNPAILEQKKDIESNSNLLAELSEKIDLIKNESKERNKNFLNLIEKTQNEFNNNIIKLEKDIGSISLLNDEIDFCENIILGKEQNEKYKKMSKEEKNAEISVGNSIKEEINMHGNYLNKLSEGINKVNNRINNLNKENLALIKKDLKSESNFILEDFKQGLKESINKIETQLKDKVDKLGLDQFWNKINEQLIEEMKRKIDKKEMNKNNMYLKKKIDNLESKISRTLVDTLIDLQMDESPLIVKKNFREINEQKCASCGQSLQNVVSNGILGNSLDFNNYNNFVLNQNKTFRTKNIGDKNKLPEIKTNLQK